MLTLRGISKSYGNHQILTDLDFSLGAKEFISIIGTSGTGKTTLLSILAGLVRPDSGTITFHDQDITALDEEHLARFRLMHIGIVFQDFKIIPSLSVYDNVLVAIFPRRDIAPPEKNRRVHDMVCRVGLGDKLSARADTLSGGEKQRVAIARSLVGAPQLVLADEPTGNLDEETSAHIMRLFHDLHDALATSFVIITHDHDVAQQTQKTYRLTNHHLQQL